MTRLHVSRWTLEFPVDGTLYLFNPLSGAFDRLTDRASQTEWALLKSSGSCSPAVKELLLPRGYVYEDASEEEALAERLLSLVEAQGQEVIRGHLILSYDCNLRCTYCYEEGIAREPAVMDTDRLERTLKTIKGLEQPGRTKKTQLVFFGGEPLLPGDHHRARVHQALEYARENGWEVEVITNGVNLEAYVPLLRRYQVSQMQVTLDGPKRIHDLRRPTVRGDGSFDRIVSSINAALEADLPVVIRVNADNQNIEYAPELAAFFDSTGWLSRRRFGSYWGVTFDTHGTHAYCEPAHVMLEKILETRRRHPLTSLISLEAWQSLQFLLYPHMRGQPRLPKFFFCGGQRNEWCFDLYGDLYFCANGVGREEFKVGSFDPVLRVDHDRAASWREANVLRTQSGCGQCPARLCCGGGCYFRRVCAVGSPSATHCTEGVLPLLTTTVEYLHRWPEIFRQQEFAVSDVAENGGRQ